MATYTIVAAAVLSNVHCSSFITYIEADSALKAKEAFKANAEVKARYYRVIGVFVGKQIEMLSTYESQPSFLGEYTPKADYDPNR